MLTVKHQDSVTTRLIIVGRETIWRNPWFETNHTQNNYLPSFVMKYIYILTLIKCQTKRKENVWPWEREKTACCVFSRCWETSWGVCDSVNPWSRKYGKVKLPLDRNELWSYGAEDGGMDDPLSFSKRLRELSNGSGVDINHVSLE